MVPLNNFLWWCKSCGVPLLRRECENCGHEGVRICSDLKPMFSEECRFLEKESGRKLPGRSWLDGLWMRYKSIWFNGKRLLRLSANGKPTIIKEYFHRDLTNTNQYVTQKTLYKANKTTLDGLEKKAISFIKEIIKSFPGRKPVVSFSGGKDSTVISYLVRKALGTNKVLHIFGNTTIEYPDTHNYIDRFFRNNKGIPLYENSSKHTFLKMCKLIGPPSRINAWCCSVFKAAPIATIVNRVNGTHGVISFEGIRKKESVRRRNRQSIYTNKKIVHQLSAYPILDWREIEVWFYILIKGLDFNDAYRKGFSRVGCLYCPNNIRYNEYLIKTYYPKEARKWETYFLNYARKIGKEDPLDYFLSGAWKMRVGKSEGKSLVYVRKVPCLRNLNAMHFILDKPIAKDFGERFKPFGRMQNFSDNIGKGFIVKDIATEESLFMIKRVNDISILKKESKIDPNWKLGREFLCVDILTDRNSHYLIQSIERQIRKFQVCISCGACAGICPTNAIKINPHFAISEDKCIHCGRCLSSKYIKSGCVSLNTQQQRKGFSNGNRL
jgi:phosphoadenosine phosphosulfate reductase